ncbi:MAG: glycosyltransferase family 1 protein [Acidobacteria bacterium]|nr:glycosyltransferase family 1 protein [Acidobacteriota bacterium]
MKTIHLTNAWHASSGGIATHYRSLLNEAERTGQQLAMVVPGAEDGVERKGSTRIHSVKAVVSPFNSAYRSIMPNAWPGVSRRVVEILLEDQPDLIEICDKYSLHYLAGLIRKEYLKGFAKRPVLIGLSCERMDDNLGVYLTRSPVGKAFARWYMKWVYFGFFDHHIVNSEHVAMELREASRGHVRERGIYVRPPGSRSLDVRRLNPTSDWAARWPPRSFVRRPGWHGRRTSRC